MRKIYILISVFGVALIIFIAVMYKLIEVSESESSKKMVVTCQIGKLAVYLTEYYVENKKYPVISNKLDIDMNDFHDLEKGCGIDVFIEFSEKRIKDPWGDELVFESLSEEKVVFYSINKSDSRMTLYRGGIKIN